MSQKQQHRSIGVKAAPQQVSQREDNPAIKEILDTVTEKCAKQIRSFIRANERAQRGHLAEMWEQGRVVETLKAKEYQVAREGEKLINTIGMLAQIADCSESYLNKMAQFFRLCPSEEEKNNILALRLKNGKQLVYAHWEQLMKFAPVKEGESRDKLDTMIDKTIENSWSPLDLSEHIKMSRTVENQQPRGGGRPTKVPPTFHSRLSRLVSQTTTILKNAREIYSHEKHNLYESIKDMPQEDVAKDADNMLAGVKKLSENLRQLADWCEEMLDDTIVDVSKYISKCSCSYTEESGKAAAAALEEEDAEC